MMPVGNVKTRHPLEGLDPLGTARDAPGSVANTVGRGEIMLRLFARLRLNQRGHRRFIAVGQKNRARVGAEGINQPRPVVSLSRRVFSVFLIKPAS